jgi:ketosteroid isomerase-like protein
MAALYTEDAVLVTNRGPVYGREAIEKYYESLFQNVHISNFLGKVDPVRGIRKGMADNEMLTNGEWSSTIQVKGANPVELKGYWGSIKVLEGDTWKIRLDISNVTPKPAGTPSPTTTPSNQ